MERWPFGAKSAAALVARVAWPNDRHAEEWAPKMLTNEHMREQTIAQARERFEMAITEITQET